MGRGFTFVSGDNAFLKIKMQIGDLPTSTPASQKVSPGADPGWGGGGVGGPPFGGTPKLHKEGKNNVPH